MIDDIKFATLKSKPCFDFHDGENTSTEDDDYDRGSSSGSGTFVR